jgi:hypothetical protein
MKTTTKVINRFAKMKVAALTALAFATLASTPAIANDNDNDGDDFKFDLIRSQGLANFPTVREYLAGWQLVGRALERTFETARGVFW